MVAQIAQTRVPDAVWEAVKPHFTEQEIADLMLLIIAINSRNRIAVSFRKMPESVLGGCKNGAPREASAPFLMMRFRRQQHKRRTRAAGWKRRELLRRHAQHRCLPGVLARFVAAALMFAREFAHQRQEQHGD